MEINPIPPYLASISWMQGKAERSSHPAREYTRTLIESNCNGGMTLTVPVIGGSSSVKRLHPSQLLISSHGDWPRIHLGAIEAAYGKEPYFQHFFPSLASIIADYPQHLWQLNVLLMEKMIECAGYDENIPGIRDLQLNHPDRFAAISARLEEKINPDHSFVEALFRLGPDVIFLL